MDDQTVTDRQEQAVGDVVATQQGPESGPEPPRRTAPKRTSPPRRRSRVVRRLPGIAGVVGAVLFFSLSLTPSLLPRSWVLQGVVGGVTAAMGYGVAALLGWAGGAVVRWRPTARVQRMAWLVVGLGAVVLVPVSLWLGARWQQDVRVRMEMDPYVDWNAVAILLLAAAVFGLLLLVARSLRLLTRTLASWLDRLVPRPVASAIGVTIVAFLVVGFAQGFLFNAFVTAANRVSSLANGGTSPSVHPPTSPQLSGGLESLVPWKTLGVKGRDFIGKAPTPAEIASFSGRPAKQPVRVYVGLDSAGSTEARAQLAVRELERTGAFRRKVLAVITSTGTGWVDPQTADSLEFLYNGDTAEVAMQYSYLPSWISFLVDRSKAADAAAALNDAVLAKWRTLPVASRPKLVVFGESLGSYGTEEAFRRLSAITAETDGALLVGPPNVNPIWRRLTNGREPGTPQWRPVFDQGRVARFANAPAQLTAPATEWTRPRVAYLQHGSDPVVWWSPDLVLHRPDWLVGKRAPDVSPEMSWHPFVTFWQLVVDLAFANSVPSGHGHRYGAAPAAGWAAIIPPPGWTGADTARLTNLMQTR